jgi:hypothetical protein
VAITKYNGSVPVVPELEMRSGGYCQRNSRMHLNFLFLLSEFAPKLAVPIEEMPNLLDGFVFDGVGNMLSWKRAMALSSASYARQQSYLGSIGCRVRSLAR